MIFFNFMGEVAHILKSLGYSLYKIDDEGHYQVYRFEEFAIVAYRDTRRISVHLGKEYLCPSAVLEFQILENHPARYIAEKIEENL